VVSVRVTAALDNPYWDAVRDHIDPTGSLWRTPSVNGFGRYRDRLGHFDPDRWARESLSRRDFVGRYSWTIPDPVTLAFVAEHSMGRLVDPMAGTGYWAHLLAQLGVDTACYDLEPGTNLWHADQPLFVPVLKLDGRESVTLHPDRALFLSWPPYDVPVGTEIVQAYAGTRVIFIGEPESGCTGDDALYELFEADWSEVAEHVPVQWDGIHDRVTVYDRRGAA
jgi:hypothetical protein